MVWGSKIWFLHGEENSRGVSIMFSKHIKPEIHNVLSSENSRYLILYYTLNNKKLLFANVYTPNLDDPQFFTDFFEQIARFDLDYLIPWNNLCFRNVL